MVNNHRFVFYNLWEGKRSHEIETVFPSWAGQKEVIVVFSPHDDDALLGAGYILQAAQYFGAEVYLVVVCNGCGGYTTLDEKDRIVSIRKEETVKAYSRIGIQESHIIRMEYPDFSLRPNIGWKMPWGGAGTMEKTITVLRSLGATRLLLPNPYREHIDHEATYLMGAWDGPQAGDPIMPDYGQLQAPIKTYLEYSVWGKFSPFHALAAGRDPDISANVALGVSRDVEERVVLAISEYKSQARIISELLRQRQERKVEDNLFIEPYLSFEARPKFDFSPYVSLVREINKARS